MIIALLLEYDLRVTTGDADGQVTVYGRAVRRSACGELSQSPRRVRCIEDVHRAFLQLCYYAGIRRVRACLTIGCEFEDTAEADKVAFATVRDAGNLEGDNGKPEREHAQFASLDAQIPNERSEGTVRGIISGLCLQDRRSMPGPTL